MSGLSLWSYYVQEGQRQMEAAGVDSAAAWEARRPQLHRQYMASMGLDPLPPRCELAVREHETFSGQGYRATRLAWQILPDCWATGHYYVPEGPTKEKRPAILYVCGHHAIGVQGYQYHAAAWARRGYACLILDTVEQHDNPGDHHGLYFGQRSDWISMGYTAAGGELWNSIRALDVLAGREEVDPKRLGVTGASGGGAASFFLAVADRRVAAAATVMGVSSFAWALRDRFLRGHCDCMYPHNPYGRDIAEFAALVAPRPLLFVFARHDPLYCPEEFRALAKRTGRVYELLGKEDSCRLVEHDGAHEYLPQTIEAVQSWFDRHFQVRNQPILNQAGPENNELDEAAATIFNGAPPQPDRLNLLPELLSPAGSVTLPRSAEQWETIRRETLAGLRRDVLMRAQVEPAKGEWHFEEMGQWLLGKGAFRRMYRAHSDGMEVMATLTAMRPDYRRVLLSVAGPDDEMRSMTDRLAGYLGDQTALLAVEPRGTGFSSVHEAHARHYLRAGALVGLTPVMLMIQDLWRLMPHVHGLEAMRDKPLFLHGRGEAGVAALYHAISDPKVAGVILERPPVSHRDGGYILNVLRYLDMPQAAGLMAPRPVGIVIEPISNMRRWQWTHRLFARLNRNAALAMEPSLSNVAAKVFAAVD